MQAIELKKPQQEQGNVGRAEVGVNHLGDRLLITARLVEGDRATVTAKLTGRAEGKGTINLTREKPYGGLFVKMPEGSYTLEVSMNGEQVFTEQFTASPSNPSSPLLPAVFLTVLALWGW